ncbi:MAG: archaetidylserine decarboxylase [Myxococcaceae bacterium]|nr:archaetidylserine decarboxylase [Myxococcaceae bacterium]
MNDQTFMKLVGLLPKSALSAVVGAATRAPAPAGVHRAAMRVFAKRFAVDVDEAEHGFEGYRTFGEFFARGLKPGARPIAPGERVVISPVDGAVSQRGDSEGGLLVQAKGITYTVAQLLGDAAAAAPFEGGAWTTLYLSPRDYHRIHAPLSGRITGYAYIPGEFWPVNPASVANKHALFAINERLTTYMDTPLGRLALVKVGATCVSRIRVTYADIVTHRGEPGRVHTFDAPIPIQKGAELGRFEMGSTVILLFEKGRVRWDQVLLERARVRLGMRIGEGAA